MRFVFAVALFVSSCVVFAQEDLWSHVSRHMDNVQLADATVSDARQQAIQKLLRESRKSIGWECSADQINEMLKALTYHAIPLADGQDVLLVQAGAGCARGGQGSNGAMWLVRFVGETPELIATPKGGFDGWIFSIPAFSSHGLHDIVLGWSMGASAGSLNYFRFDGKSYCSVGSATYAVDDDEKLIIVPVQKG